MLGDSDIRELANDYALRYIEELNYKYSLDKAPLDEGFVKEVMEIIKVLGEPALGFGMERLYELVKTKIHEREEGEAEALRQANQTIAMFGNGAILKFDEVRPFFEVPKGSKLYLYNVKFQNEMPPNVYPFKLQKALVIPSNTNLVIRDATVVYSGELGKFIKEYVSPSVFII